MKSLLTLAILFICSIAISQENGIYTDTVNKFSIGVPSGWQIRKGLSENSPTLSVFLPKMQGHGILPSYDVNLIRIPNSSFEKTFALFREGYVLSKDTIENEGVSVINRIQFKWILKKNNTPTKDRSLVYFGYNEV